MKNLVENCLALDLGALTRAGVFRLPVGTLCDLSWTDAEGREILRITFHLSGGPPARLIHVNQPEGPGCTVRLTFNLTYTQCRFGGLKYFVQCPGKRAGNVCDRRVRKLYLIGGRWCCRTCGNLTYLASHQHDRRKDALLRNPLALQLALQSDDPRQQMLALGAFAQTLSRLQRVRR